MTSNANSLEKAIIEEAKRGRRVKDIIKELEKRGFDREEILRNIVLLAESGKITLEKPLPTCFREYVFSRYTIDFWLLLAILLSTIFSTLLISPESNFALIRWTFAFIFVLFVPGITLTKIIKPNADVVELVVYGFSLSVIISVLIGVMLNYLWMLKFIWILFSLSSATLVLLLVMLMQDYRRLRQLKQL